MIKITIDGRPVEACTGETVLTAARRLGIDIPTLCWLEKCGALNSCLVCLVKIKGKLVPACGMKVEAGMVIESETDEVHEARRTALELLFSDHVGDCLSPCDRLCPLKLNIPAMLRQVQAGKFGEAIVTVREALPLPGVLGWLCHHPCEQGCRRATWDEAAAINEIERIVDESDSDAAERWVPPRKHRTGNSVVIIGAGPAGLAAAFHLLREGDACTIVDRNPIPGGTLKDEIENGTLPPEVLERDIKQLEKLGVQFKLGVALGDELTLEGLLLGFDAILVATGETAKPEGETMGLEMTASGIKCNPDTFQTKQPAVFAAGRAARSMSQLVRAMSDGVAAAECIHQFISGAKVQRRDKPFSSVMGPLDPNELATFLQGADLIGRVKPRHPWIGLVKKEASIEASRCLHCDCRSVGNCRLQFYAHRYGVNASRYRQRRPKFEQLVQPGGIIFEPGKCILCGICVKLTELAREPLGLTFIGRGFDVRVAAPLNRSIQEGLQEIGRECVENCPTGALSMATD
jgi:NADPH-dependent glutamate synthase beta subunit-like oxidoreductase